MGNIHLGNNLKNQEDKIIEKCMKKGYTVYRIQDRLFIRKGEDETYINFEGKSYEDVTNKMIKYLKRILKE